MEMTITYPDLVATPRAVRATFSFSATYEQAAQPIFVNWGDGSAETLLPSGTLIANHTYAKDGHFVVSARSNSVRVHKPAIVGHDQLGPFYDPDKRRLTEQQRWQRERDRVAQLRVPKEKVGRSKTRLRRVPRI